MTTESLTVRRRLVEALHLDLIGPWAGHPLADEILPSRVSPAHWYLTGFIIPAAAPPEQRSAPDEEDDFELIAETATLPGDTSEERRPAKRGFFPSSIGLSFLLPPGAATIEVVLRWGDYRYEETTEGDGREWGWRRIPRQERLTVELAAHEVDGPPLEVPHSDGLVVQTAVRSIAATEFTDQLPDFARSVSVFLVNRRQPCADKPDQAYAFQAEIEVRSAVPFLARPDLRGLRADEWDEQVADLHYADTPEYAVGHAVAADWRIQDGECRLLHTTWIPGAAVEKTETTAVAGVELRMDVLGALGDGAAARAALQPLVAHYRAWIAARRLETAALPESRREVAEELLRQAEAAATRIQEGVAVLAADTDVLDAFRLANRAVSAALHRRLGSVELRWRPFQLAFILLNLAGVAQPSSADRRIVDLLFFPTGGGKTEAYFGLAALAMVLRRLRHRGDDGLAGAGVSVIMRYTLRLLTLDQLARASGLVCALELERAARPERYGQWPFEIGLWVGKETTPNAMGRKGDKACGTAREKVHGYKRNPDSHPIPVPLESCPWCGQALGPNSFHLHPNDDTPKELNILCLNPDCPFSADRGLPIVTVDDPLYRRLPAFLISTVDKFAALPWTGPSGVLLGGADRHGRDGFYGAAEPGPGKPLNAPLPPPDLVIQDELHLISGPLGTMAGLYETAVEALARGGSADRELPPKIVASTATVRNAGEQIQALFSRPITQVFPPPGPDRRDSFFARTVPESAKPARLYVGVSAQGRNPKVIMRKVWLALMGAAQRAYTEAGGDRAPANPADPYMTVVGYFNSLRELGGARRLLEEEVQNTLKDYGVRKRLGEKVGLFADRPRFSEVVELTSRESTAKVAESRRRLGCRFRERERVDCAIATNMISVGLDIPRLGLMVVLGQPKTTAEYIQATSRVGRDDNAPGLVVTLLNLHKPRDRSHYERFRHYHETFYRSVEVGSVTPFSARALDRGLAAVLVALVRHGLAAMTPAEGAAEIEKHRPQLEEMLQRVFLARLQQQPLGDEEEREQCWRGLQDRIGDLLDSWLHIRRNKDSLQYQKYEKKEIPSLLRETLETDFASEHERKFKANRSLRDVEPEVHLTLKEIPR